MIPNFFNKPYPFIESPIIRLSLAFIIGLVVFLLLQTYRPYGIEQIPKSETAFVAGLGLMAMISLLVSLFIFPKFINAEQWTIRSEILLHLFNWLLTSTLAFTYNTYVGAHISPQHSLPQFVLIVAGIYFVPLLVMIFITEKYLQQLNEQAALQLNDRMDNNDTDEAINDPIIIVPDTASTPNIELNTGQFIYAASDNNYVILYYLDDKDIVDKQLVRLSLKKLESQLKDQSDIIRCHKSYLVNRNHIEEVSGNARSLYLKINHSDFQIPVSRSFDRSQLS